MADRALRSSDSPAVSRNVLRQRSDSPNYHNGSYNSDYHNIKHYDCYNNYTVDNDDVNYVDGYYNHN